MSKSSKPVGGIHLAPGSGSGELFLTPDGWEGEHAKDANKTVPLSDWRPSDGHRYAWAINKLAKLWNGQAWFADHVKPRREA